MSRAATVTRTTRKRNRRTTTAEAPRWVNNLAAARLRARKSQAEVAEHIGRKQNLVSAIERGTRSGREYMDEIAAFLRVSDPETIFPYYNYYSFEEAAELLGVSSTMIARRVDVDGVLSCETIGGVRLIPKSELQNVELRKRTGKTKRAALRELLEASSEGLTSLDMLDAFGPFENDDARKKALVVIQTILSRSPEFEKHVSGGREAPLWTVSAT